MSGALVLAGCGSGTSVTPHLGSSPTPAPRSSVSGLAAGIVPLTSVDASAMTGGYFSDPLPVHRSAAAGSYIPSLVGTTHEVLECTALAAGCYTPSALSIVTGSALQSTLPAGATLVGYQNNNAYQDESGNWQMATTATVSDAAANPQGLPWNVILHASPVSGSALSPNGVPLSWQSDTLLVGSFTAQAPANYDGKYVEDDGLLYLVYSKNLQSPPAASSSQDGIVAQPMSSATQLANTAPTTLLGPTNNADGGYNSELYYCRSTTDKFKLIETGNISVVNGKYAMAYSTGSYETPCYKAGIAWSDAFLGPYKKILQQDTKNVWANPTAEPEVVYLLQSIEPNWPNYVASTVQGPGVPSLVQYPLGTWYLYFAGYAPSVALQGNLFDPQLRQPYAMRLTVDIPSGASVASTANAALASWITAAK